MKRRRFCRGVMLLFLLLVAAGPVLAGHTGFNPQRGRLLVASETMTDPRFAESVILLIQHNHAGSVGLIMNSRSELLPHDLPEEVAAGMRHIYFGGPVEPLTASVLVFGQRPSGEAKEILNDVYLISVTDLARSLTQGESQQFRIFLGYAGWAPGQLEMELAHGSWQVHPADGHLLFRDSVEQLWWDLQKSGPVISL